MSGKRARFLRKEVSRSLPPGMEPATIRRLYQITKHYYARNHHLWR